MWLPEQSAGPSVAPSPDHGAASAGSTGLFGRRRKQAEAEAERLAGELALCEERTRGLLAQVDQLTEQLAGVIGADSATIAAEQERLRRAHAEKLEELQRIDGLLDAKAEHAAERAARSLVDVRSQAQALAQQAEQARRQVAAAQADLVVIDEVRMLQEAGIYEYRHPLADAVAYAGRLEELKSRYKQLARDDRAVLAAQDWTVNGSLAQGRKMVRDFSKLMLRAYNAEADNAVRGMKPHRLSSLIDRLGKTRESIARLGATMHIRISDEYHRLRVQELELTADHLARKEAEKEEQRELRARQREEERLQREIERERQRLEKERSHYESALRRLRAGTGDPAGIAELEGKLQQLGDDLRAVEAREANIHELGDASVPFRFDVHALIFSEDAVGLERRLHLQRLAGQHLLEFTDTAEAPEWRAGRTPAPS
ncbi:MULTISPECIES: DUF4041 domain-containing protein [unclassified Streptomyces]|uniref:DUF4041 domain-containing protein n=1 Tax=unclassified Streptomyces TaxID=2593676 RepID=UPI0035DEAE20